MGTPHWKQDETDYLYEIVGFYPLKELTKRYRNKAREEGWVDRTDIAIEVKVRRMKMSVRALDANFNALTLTKILGYKSSRVYSWIRLKKLPTTKVGAFHRITQNAINEFARKYPQYLADADEQGLRFLLGDKRAEEIKGITGATHHTRAVRCKVTGKIYSSISEASRLTRQSRKMIAKRAHQGITMEFLK